MNQIIWGFLIAIANLICAAHNVHRRQYGYAVFSFGVFLVGLLGVLIEATR